MCGIAGIIAYSPASQPVEEQELLRMRDHMVARGPDGSGLWLDERFTVGLAHRRLSIIDLSDNGAQPMQSTDGRLTIIFNGEIYNYRDLREQLIAHGCAFRSDSDTEVLLHLYRMHGKQMLPLLRGMFAFALWDEDEAKMLLARDPYGIKPLYFADNGHRTCFASQVKAILAGGVVDSALDTAGWAGFYLFGFVPEPFTQHAAIRALPAGCFVEIGLRDGFGPVQCYHSIAKVWREADEVADADRPAWTDLREAVRQSVAAHMVADVPVGCFLSGGIDSAVLLGLMSELSAQPICAITLSFDEFANTANDEVALATEVARHYLADHHIYRVGRQDFQDDLSDIFYAMDQPSIDGVNSWFVTKAAASLGLKVAFSGLGGDELLGGYTSFTDIPRWVRSIRPVARFPGAAPLFRAIVRTMQRVRPFGPPKVASLVDHGSTYPGAYLLRRGLFMPDELASLMGEEAARDGLARLRPMSLLQAAISPCPASPFGRVSTLESSIYMRSQLLRDVDWASMAHSVEVRVPLADAELLRTIALGGGHFTKQMLAQIPQRPVPQAVMHKLKTGFATPMSSWSGDVSTEAVGKRPLSGASSRQWAHHVSSVWH